MRADDKGQEGLVGEAKKIIGDLLRGGDIMWAEPPYQGQCKFCSNEYDGSDRTEENECTDAHCPATLARKWLKETGQ